MRPARKLSALVALGAAAALALTGCTQKNQADTGASGGAGASAPASTYKVAFVPKLQGVPYFEAMNAGGQKAAAALGNVEWLYQGPTQADAAAQVLSVAPAEGDRVRRVFGGEDVFGARRSGWWVASG